jgi:hypothetical protein
MIEEFAGLVLSWPLYLDCGCQFSVSHYMALGCVSEKVRGHVQVWEHFLEALLAIVDN